jgi:hypothetical protein
VASDEKIAEVIRRFSEDNIRVTYGHEYDNRMMYKFYMGDSNSPFASCDKDMDSLMSYCGRFQYPILIKLEYRPELERVVKDFVIKWKLTS